MPIPSIQTTAPLDGMSTSLSPLDGLTRSSSASSAYSTGTLATSNGPLSNYPTTLLGFFFRGSIIFPPESFSYDVLLAREVWLRR